MKFLHCADVHIGKYQSSGGVRQGDFIAAFSGIAALAKERKAELLLVAGDLFDLRALQPRTLSATADILRGLLDAGIETVVIEGNHDRVFTGDSGSWLTFLADMGLIRLLAPASDDGVPLPETAMYERGDCVIYGLGYPGASVPKLAEAAARIPATDKFTIVMLHAGLAAQLPRDLARIQGSDIDAFAAADYVALGHIHKRYEYGVAQNPGSTETCDISEAQRGDVKGVYLVETSGKQFTSEFIPLNVRPHKFYSFDVADGDTSHIIAELSAQNLDGAVVSLTLSTTGLPVDVASLTEALTETTHACELLIEVESRGETGGNVPTVGDMRVLENSVIAAEIAALGYDGAAADVMGGLVEEVRSADFDAVHTAQMCVHVAKELAK